MIRSLLVGLDGTDDSNAVLELGIGWAKRFDALAVGLGIVDEPGILSAEAARFAGGHHWHAAMPTPLLSNSCHKIAQVLQQFARRCDEARVVCRIVEDVGPPHARILEEAQRFDLIMLGRQTHFRFGGGRTRPTRRSARSWPPAPGRSWPCPTTRAAATRWSSPTTAACRPPAPSSLPDLGPGPVADGPGREGRPTQEAARSADRAVITSSSTSGTRPPRSSAVTRGGGDPARGPQVGSRLRVMGAYGQPILREFFLGSMTRTLLKESPVPVFCYH